MKHKVVLTILSFVIVFSIASILLLRSETSYSLSMDDVSVPKLIVKEQTVSIKDYNYNVYNNINAVFGISGGSVTCDENIQTGVNYIKCVAKGNNGLAVEKTYKLINSTTLDKSIIFFGDSITVGYGSKSKEYSYVDYIDENYDFSDVVNAANNDFRVSTYQRPNKWIVSEVLSHYEDTNYDYVIMQGGVNDVLWNTPLGELTPNFTSKLDTDTFYGGLETYIRNVIEKWPNSKIGYIITYYTPNYSEKGEVYSFEHYKQYYDAIKKTLLKYNISYLDLFEGKSGITSYSSILNVEDNTYLIDDLHLNDEGYKVIGPHIYSWISNLSNYEKNSAMK